MKKSLWMLGVALTALASCAETEVVDVPQTRAIGFTNAFVNNTTRADVTTDTFGKFWVSEITTTTALGPTCSPTSR